MRRGSIPWIVLAPALLLASGCPNTAGSGGGDGGPTRREAIESRWAELQPAYSGFYYTEPPDWSGPSYATGALAPEFLQDGLNMANFVRFLAGLPDDLALDPTLQNQV